MIYRFTPGILKNLIRRYRTRRVESGYRSIYNGYHDVLTRLRSKQQVKVAFFLIESSMWKYDELFKIMVKDPCFEPVVVICPYTSFEGSEMLDILNRSIKFISEKGYPYVSTYDPDADRWMDVRNTVKPDIVFYTFPYDLSTRPEYTFSKLPDSLSCYVPYSSMVCLTPMQFDKPIQNYAWRFFVENEIIRELTEKNSPTKGINTYATGFPSLDIFSDQSYKPNNVWIKEQPIKIIWAPHYTVQGASISVIAFASFLQYADSMIELANKYRHEIQIAFKPHPFLKATLKTLWGIEKTEEYYCKWADMPNTFLQTGEYVDLFRCSDAMIFDSVSFISEYLYTCKPSLFTFKPDILSQLNEFGIAALECHSKAYCIEDIDNFIRSRIRGDIDNKYQQKKDFYDKYLFAGQTLTASQNIANNLKKAIFE